MIGLGTLQKAIGVGHKSLTVGIIAAVGLLSAPSLAQEIEPLEVAQDANGIDLLSNNVSTPQRPTLSIPAAPELAFSDILDFMPVIEVTTGDNPQETDEVYRVSAGGIASDGFESRLCTFNECTSVKGNGSRLFLNGDEGQFGGGLGGYRYMQGGTGRQMTFDIETEYSSGAPVSPVRKFLAERIYNPGGRDLGIEYESLNVMGILRHRPVRVVSTSGYALEFEYASDTSSYEWTILARAQIVHVDAPLNVLASFDYYAGGVTDIDNRLFDCGCTIRLDPTLPEHQGSRMRLPGETADAFSTTRGSGSNVRTVTTNGVTYSYTSLPDNTWSGIDDAITRLTITGPENFYRRVNVTNTLDVGADPNSNSPSIRRRIDSVVDALGNTTTYEYDTAFNRLERIVYPEGNAISVVQDLYGNIGERRVEAKPGSSEPDIVTYASYTNGLCGIGYACFRPATTTDALGNQVEYTWENSHGGLLTQLDPADEQGRRRKTINTWSGTAPINGETCGTFNGQLGTQPFPCAPRITRTEVCEANAAGNEVTCGTANSFVQEFTYYEATSLPLTVTVTDGLGNNPLTTTYTYDDAGRVLSEDGPLPGSDDAVYYQYDILGRRIWEVGPKNEAGRRAATRTTYRTNDDQVEMVESGHVNGAANIGTFTLVRRVETDYNADRLPTHVRTYEGNLTTPENVAQTSYDSLNRAECSAIRMNPAAFGSLPASACTLGAAGAHGEDRITQTVYDNEGRTTQVIQGLGTTLERTYATYEYSDNGQMLSMTDARGFRAEMTYDGFDRQTHWYFPNPGATGVANMADYEQYTYDANGNRTQLRRRDGVLINFDYDDLGRMTRKFFPVDRPGLDPMFQRDVYYQYDIRGLQTRARFDSINGEGLTTAYDTFGRVISNTMTMDGQTRTLGYGYNAAGSRTSITFPDAVSFDYQYTSGGFFNALRIPGSVVFANYNYNQRGEVDEIQRANSAPDQQFTYDDFGRLASTGWGTTGTYDATWSFTRNPASQILTESSTNGVFAWNAHPSGTTTANYTVNGLNQYTQINGNGFCHDANGNLTADATYAYLYDNENRLVQMRARVGSTCPANTTGYTGALSAQLEYDPMGRLYEVRSYTNGSLTDTRHFLYDGDALVAEYSTSGTMLARYLHGPAAGVDDPLVSFAGASAVASNATLLYADARGSIVFTTNRWNTTPHANTYDPYGVPGTGNTGRFQYTGQIWLEALGLYYYKARMYSPTLGRFMQTDPIGYEDNVNLYGYVGNDPVNGIDPTGTELWIHGTPEYVVAVQAQIARLIEHEGGAALVRRLAESEFRFEIRAPENEGDGNSFRVDSPTDASDGTGSGGTIFFDPSNTQGGMNDAGQTDRPAFVGLGHEFGHGSASEYGNQSFDYGNGDPGTTPPAELHSLANENMIRREHGLPERGAYYPSDVACEENTNQGGQGC